MYASAEGINLKVPNDYYDGNEFACSYLADKMRLPPFDFHSKMNGYEYLRLITDLGKESAYYYRPKQIIIIPMLNVKRQIIIIPKSEVDANEKLFKTLTLS